MLLKVMSSKMWAVISFTVLDDLMLESYLSGAAFHHTYPQSDTQSGILPVSALNQMTDSHLMEASLSKQTQYTPTPLGPPSIQKRNNCLQSTGILFRESLLQNLWPDMLWQTVLHFLDLAPAWKIDIY